MYSFFMYFRNIGQCLCEGGFFVNQTDNPIFSVIGYLTGYGEYSLSLFVDDQLSTSSYSQVKDEAWNKIF